MNMSTARTSVVAVLCVLTGAAIFLALPLKLGFLDLGIYQLPAFLLIRYVSGVRLSLIASYGLVLVFLVGDLPIGVYVEAASFIVLVLALDSFANTGRAEHRLVMGFSTILLACFPFYTSMLAFLREEATLLAAAHAAAFVFSTVFSLVIAELIWALSTIIFSGYFQRMARHEVADRASIRSLGTVFISVLVTVIFFVFLQIWSGRWEAVLTTTTRDLVDQTAQRQLSNELHRSELEVRSAGSRFGDQPAPWMYLGERYIFLGLDVKAETSAMASPRVIGNVRGTAAEPLISLVDKHLAKFVYRASMGAGFARLKSPLFLDFGGESLPVYSDVLGDQILFVVDTAALSGNSFIETQVADIGIRKVSASDLMDGNLGVAATQIIDPNWMGGILWNSVSTNDGVLSRLGALNRETMLSVPLSPQLAAQFAQQLPSSEVLVLDLKVWPRLQVFFRATMTMALFFTLSLLFTSVLTMRLVGRLIKPVNRLLEGLEGLKIMHERLAESQSPIEPIEIESKAISSELNRLQETIVWFSKEVATADHQLRSAVVGYEALLSSLPLGVMEIDADYGLRFRNEAMSLITGDSAEASFRLRQRAEYLFERGEVIDEYALALEGQPQKNLLLAITSRKDNQGSDSGFWLLVNDLTKQKAMDSQLLQTAKLATLGEMSTGMAHELNQPLNIIKLAANNMSNSLAKGRASSESMMSRIQRIDAAVDRAATIIDHMRAFGRVAGEDFAPFDVSSSIAAASDLVREPMAAKGILLSADIETTARVLGNTIQFEQVLINMINNARDAILANGTSGTIVIDQTLDEGHVIVAIQDSGGGIPADALPHIFEPFYTTKPVGKGTGLGGSISYGIVQDMQGNIWAENVGGGAKISIRLPLVMGDEEHEVGSKI